MSDGKPCLWGAVIPGEYVRRWRRWVRAGLGEVNVALFDSAAPPSQAGRGIMLGCLFLPAPPEDQPGQPQA
mgnify:CR=1 FL=1